MPAKHPAAKPAKVFFTALVMALLVFLPFIIYNKGMFLYYGDFNVQQIPFYMHVHDALLQGGLGWDPITDLGVDLLTSYSFYCITSPFFLLTLPLLFGQAVCGGSPHPNCGIHLLQLFSFEVPV